MKSITNPLFSTMLRTLVLALVIVVSSFAAAQIGETEADTVGLLGQYEPEPLEAGYVAVGTEFDFNLVDGYVLGLAGSGPLGEPQLRFIGALIGAGSGYGADMAAPVTNYLRQQQDEFVGLGPILVEVGDFYMMVDITETDEGRAIAFGLSPRAIDDSQFRTARHTLGADDAAFVLRVFSDFECPYCAMFEENGMPIVQELLTRGDFRFEFHHFPLRSHPNAAFVAEASECIASLAGAEYFWAFHDLVFAEQNAWAGTTEPLPIMLDYAAQVGADHPALQACIVNGDEAEEVSAAFNHAVNDIRVTGTPTLYINGVKLSDYSSIAAFERAMRIAELIDQSPGAP